MAEGQTHRRARSITSLVRRQESSGPTVLSILVSAYQVRWRNVEERLATHPHEATQLDSSGCSVLYRALIRRTDDYPPYPLVRAILRAYPRAVWERHHQMTLLEIAVRRMASLETLELLCQARPAIPEDALAVPALWQIYSSHYGSEERLISLLQSGSSEAFALGCKFQLLLRYLTTEHLVPCSIHTFVTSPHCSLDLFKTVSHVFANELYDGNYGLYELTPLQLALESAKKASVLKKNNQVSKANYLRDLDPNFAHKRTPAGRLPIHLATDAGIINYMSATRWIGNTPHQTLGCLDPESGLFPFQMAAASDAPVATIYTMLRACPKVIGEPARWERRSKNDKIPSDMINAVNPQWITPKLEQLLDAVEPTRWGELQKTLRTPVDPLWHQLIGAARVFGCPLPLLKMLIEMHPEKLLHEDKRGWLPLHHAVLARQGDQSEQIRMILKACPKAANHRDKNGLLPLHLAILSGKGTRLLELLLDYNPTALYEPDSILGLPPALFAAQWPRSSLSNVFHLISSAPDLVVCAASVMSQEERSPMDEN